MSIQTITGVPPIEFLSVGQPLSAWSISGNGQQTGTPTPDNPIMPEFVGVKTANLWDNCGFSTNVINNTHTHISSNSYGTTLSGTTGNAVQITQSDNTDGGTSYQNGFFMFDIDLSTLTDGSTYVFSFDFNVTNKQSSRVNTIAYIGSSSNTVTVYQTSSEWGKSGTAYITFEASSAIVNPYIEIRLCGNSINVSNVQMVKGNTLQTYEPYGYKLPITCGQTTPVYLGQTQTVRRIKKLVLTGEETITARGGKQHTFGFSVTASLNASCFSSHYIDISSSSQFDVVNGVYIRQTTFAYISDLNYSDAASFKQYLRDEYAAGHPVTIWYVLETPETGIVNEPLCKIGDYADTVSSTNTGAPSIPTSEGNNTLTIGTTLQPSEVSITYMAPNTIAENLQRLQIARTNIATAITTKGGTLVENAGFEDFPNAINTIPIVIENYMVSRYIDFDAPSTSFLVGNLSNVNAFAGRRRCNVSDDGTINAYYGDPSYTEDGSNGQVMVYQPKFYYKVEPLALEEHTEDVSGTSYGLGYHMTRAIYSISDQPLTGFKVHPAFKNEAGNEVDYILRGAYEGSLYDTSESVIVPYDNRMTLDGSAITIDFTADKLNSVAGVKPISGLTYNLTRANAEKLANNRGAGWHIETTQIGSAEQILYMVEHAPNSQINTAAGVTGITDNSSYNCSSLTGSTSSLGNGTGRATSTVNETGGTLNTYTAATQTAVSYRGSENDWGNIWKFIIGCNIYGDGTMLGGVPYICSNFQFAEDVHASPYESAGFTVCNADGWTKAFGYGNEEYDWLLMTSKVGAPSDGTGMVGDYFYKTTNINGHRIARLGGRWNSDARAGLFSWALNDGSSSRTRHFSARLCYVPQN